MLCVCRKRLSSPRCRSELIDYAWVVIVPGQQCIKKAHSTVQLISLFNYRSIYCTYNPAVAPSILFDQLSSLFRYYLIHGHITELLMTSTLIPIPKDKLGGASSSDNYRSIPISNTILKIFDWVVLLLFEKELRTDELQFGFQQKTSANVCTWLVVETIDYFQRNGSEVYACVMDLFKAFDRIKQCSILEAA